MSHETLANTIRSRFKTQVADVESLPTQYDNAPLDKPENAEWARITIKESESNQTSIGGSTNQHRTVGVLIVQLFAPWGQGDKEARRLADVVKAAFLAITVSGVRFRTPSVIPVGRTGDEWQINVSCPFEKDDIA